MEQQGLSHQLHKQPLRPTAPRLLRSFDKTKTNSRGRTVVDIGMIPHLEDEDSTPSKAGSEPPEDYVQYNEEIKATLLLDPKEAAEDIADAVARLTEKYQHKKPTWHGELMETISKEALVELRSLFFRRKDELAFTSPVSNRQKDVASPTRQGIEAFNLKDVEDELVGNIGAGTVPKQTPSEAGLLSDGLQFDFDGEEPASLTFDAFVETFGDILGELSPQSIRELEMLFMKIDANCDGGVDWEEFTNYIIALDKGIQSHMHDPTLRDLVLVTDKYPEMMHRGGLGCMIDCITFVPRVHQRPGGVYVTAARDGLILLWDPETMRVIRPIKHERLIKDFRDSQTKEKAAQLGKKASRFDIVKIKNHEKLMRDYEVANNLLIKGGVLQKVVVGDDEFSNATDAGVDMHAEMKAMENDVLSRYKAEQRALKKEKEMGEMDPVKASQPAKSKWIQCMSFLPRSNLLVVGSTDRIIAFYDLNSKGFPVRARLIGKTPKEQAQTKLKRDLMRQERELRAARPDSRRESHGGVISGSDNDDSDSSLGSTLTNKWDFHQRGREGSGTVAVKASDEDEYDFLETPPTALTCAVIDNDIELFSWGETNGDLHIYLLNRSFRFPPGCKNPKNAPGVRRARCAQIHEDEVTHLEYISQMEYLVSSSLDSKIVLFNIVKMEPLRIFTAHVAGVRSFAYSRTNKFMVSCGQAPTRGVIWNPAGGSLECCKHGIPGAKPGNGRCRKCTESVTKRGNIVTVAEETPSDFGGANFLPPRKNDKDYEKLRKAQSRLAATEERFSNQVQLRAMVGSRSGNGSQAVERCSVMAVIEGHTSTIVHVVMDDVNGRFMTVSEDKIIKCHDYNTLRCMQTIHDSYRHMPDNTLSAVMWDRQRQMLFAAGQKIQMWRPRKFFKVIEVSSHAAPVTCLLWNDEFGQVVSSDAESNVCVWLLETGENTFGFRNVHDGDKITAMSFDISKRRLTTGSDNGECRVWNFNCGTQLYELFRPPAPDRLDEPTGSELDAMDGLYNRSIQGSLDQLSVSVSSAVGQSVAQQSTAGTSQRPGVECSISDLISAIKGGTDKDLGAKYMCAAGSDRRIYLYDDQMPETADPDKPMLPLNSLPRAGDIGHDDDIQCLISVTRNRVASCGYDGQIILWDLATRRSVIELNLRTEEHVNDVNLFLQHQTQVARLQAKALRRRERLLDNDSSDEDSCSDPYGDEPVSALTGNEFTWSGKPAAATGGDEFSFLSSTRTKPQRTSKRRRRNAKQRKSSAIEYTEDNSAKATVECMVILPHLNAIVASGSDAIIRFWSLDSMKLIYALRAWHPNNQTIVKIATDKSNQHIISACALGYIRVWRVVQMGLDNILMNKGLTGDEHTFSPVFSVAGWQAHDEALSCLTVAEHKLAGTLLITASGDSCINLWTIEGSKVGTFGQPKPWNLEDANTWETIHVETPQLELPPTPTLAALLKGKEDPSTKSQGLSSPDKPRFESSIVTAEEEEELRGVEENMRYKLRLATINSRAEHRGGHSDMREELRKNLTPGEARWEAHFFEREQLENARTAAALGEADVVVSSKHRDIGRSLGHIAHELDLSKKKPKALHVKQREFRECVADLKRKLPGVSQTRRPSEVEFDSLMNAARNLGV